MCLQFENDYTRYLVWAVWDLSAWSTQVEYFPNTQILLSKISTKS